MAVAILGVIGEIHDTPLMAAAVASAGLLWSSRERRAWLMATVLVAAGLFWSRLDGCHCSTWWRGTIVSSKLAGQIPYVEWNDISRAVFSRCDSICTPRPEVADSVQWLEEKVVDDRQFDQYETALGKFWIIRPGKFILTWMVWEMLSQSDYESGEVKILPGDTVIDCGAHIGIFTRFALQRGASRVIAVEPDPANIAAFEANLAEEIASGKVILVKAGVWHENTRLDLFEPEANSGANSFVPTWEVGSARVSGVPVLPLDEIAQNLQLDRVDFIKMDIEGSERHALRGATSTLKQFKPRMAICTYHLPDDPAAIPEIVTAARPDYLIHGKDVEFHDDHVQPKVLYFQ